MSVFVCQRDLCLLTDSRSSGSISEGGGVPSPYSSKALGCGVRGRDDGMLIRYTTLAAPSFRYVSTTLSGSTGTSVMVSAVMVQRSDRISGCR